MVLAVYSGWEQSKNRKFLDVLPHDPSAIVVDLGCGNAGFSVQARERIGCREMWGVDSDERLLNEAEQKGLKVRKADLNLRVPFEDDFFDVVLSNQVIEHLFYPVRFIKEIHRILRPNGYAVISTENLASWDNLVALLLGYTPFSMEFDYGLRKIGNPFSPHEKESKTDYLHSHVRVFAWNGFIELAKLLKFRIETAYGNGHFLGKIGETIDSRHCRFITLRLRKN